jgi:hypothetical protein
MGLEMGYIWRNGIHTDLEKMLRKHILFKNYVKQYYYGTNNLNQINKDRNRILKET